MLRPLLLALGIIASSALAPGAPLKEPSTRPEGKFLFQPMLIWGTGEVTHQGTGYLIEHKNRSYGVTSVHFMNFEAKGLFEAVWTDIATEEPVVGFKKSIGRPALFEIVNYGDIQHDFVVMPLEDFPPGIAKLELDASSEYKAGMKLWFPNKTANRVTGYEWVEAEVLKDEGHMLRVKLLQKVKLQSQSGSPFLRQDNGSVVGMLMGGEEADGIIEIFLCPARGIVRHLEKKQTEIPLLKSISKK